MDYYCGDHPTLSLIAGDGSVSPLIADQSAIDCESAVCGETSTELWTLSSALPSYLLLNNICVYKYLNYFISYCHGRFIYKLVLTYPHRVFT